LKVWTLLSISQTRTLSYKENVSVKNYLAVVMHNTGKPGPWASWGSRCGRPCGSIAISLLEGQADRAIAPVAVLPVSNDLTWGWAVSDWAGLARLTRGHVVQHVLHRAAMRKITLQRRDVFCVKAMQLQQSELSWELYANYQEGILYCLLRLCLISVISRLRHCVEHFGRWYETKQRSLNYHETLRMTMNSIIKRKESRACENNLTAELENCFDTVTNLRHWKPRKQIYLF